jgi:hypothetical protein
MTTAVLDRGAGADVLLNDYLDHVAGLELGRAFSARSNPHREGIPFPQLEFGRVDEAARSRARR